MSLVPAKARLQDAHTSGAGDRWQIFLKGKDITHARGKTLRDIYQDIQMVFQMPMESFDPRRTLGDGIGEVSGIWG